MRALVLANRLPADQSGHSGNKVQSDLQMWSVLVTLNSVEVSRKSDKTLCCIVMSG